ncbi:MAG: hypothetical protein ACPLSO_01830 [Fervidicoccaceae archaeon]
MNYVRSSAPVLLILVLISPLSAPIVEAQRDTYKELENWIRQNLRPIGFTLYRGPAYNTTGLYNDPLVEVRLNNYSRPIVAKYSDFINMVNRGAYNLTFLVVSYGSGIYGPIVATWPPYNFTHSRMVDPIALAWGAYPTQNYPIDFFYSNEADPYTINALHFNLSEPIFSKNPEYLYSYLPLSNSSRTTLPKGENLILGLYPFSGYDEVYDVLAGALKSDREVPLPYELSRILEAMPKDDPFASTISVTWEVIGDRGYLKPAVLYNYTHLAPQNLSLIAYVSSPFYNPENMTYEQWYAEAVEQGKGEVDRTDYKVSLRSYSTRIFRPFGVPLKTYSLLIDLANSTASRLLTSSSMFFIISPEVFNGTETVKLTIADLRGRFNITYLLNIEIGPEKFKVDVEYEHFESKTSEEHASVTRQKYHYIEQDSTRSYDEDGCLVTSLNLKSHESYTYKYQSGTQPVDFGNSFELYEQGEEYSASGGGEVKIGGWLPNPPPPGNVIEVSYDLEGSKQSYWHSLHEYKGLAGGSYGNPWMSCWYYGYDDQGNLQKYSVDCYSLRYSGEACANLLSNAESWYLEKWNQINEIKDMYDRIYYKDYTSSYLDESHFNSNTLSRHVGILYMNDKLVELRSVGISEAERGWSSSYSTSTYPEERKVIILNETKSWGSCQSVSLNKNVYVETGAYLEANVWSYRTETSYNYDSWDEFPQYKPGSLEPGMNEFKSSYVMVYDQKVSYGPPSGSESKNLFVYFDKTDVFPGENVTGFVRTYGVDPNQTRVTLSAFLSFNGTTVKLNSEPSIVELDEEGVGSFTLKMPSVSDINKTFNSLGFLPPLLTVNLTAMDNNGQKSYATLVLHVTTKNLVLDLHDIDIPVPEELYKGKGLVLEKVSGTYKPLIDKPLKLGRDVYINLQVREKSSGNIVYWVAISNAENKGKSRILIDVTSLDLRENETYIVSYELAMDLSSIFQNTKYGWVKLNVTDVGLEFKLSDFTEERTNKFLDIYVPYSLFLKYYKQLIALAGNDDRFKMLLADQAIPFDLLRNALKKMIEAASLTDAEVHKILDGIFGKLDNTFLKIGPRVMFPLVLTDDALSSELEVFSKDLSFRDKRFNLTYSSLEDPDNYWSKFAKLIVLQAMMLKTYIYAESITLLASKIIALAVTLETFKGLFTYTKLWNKGNLFSFLNNKFKGGAFALSKDTQKMIGAFKVGALTTLGDFLNILALTNPWLGGMSALKGWLVNMTGDRDMASIILALIFKVIRFVMVFLVGWGEFAGEMGFEIMFQIVNFVVAHVLMFFTSLMNQLIVIQEVAKGIYAWGVIPGILSFFLKQYGSDYSFKDLAITVGAGGESKWASRQEPEPVLHLGYWYTDEQAFFFVADIYKNYVEPIASLTISTLRGLDGVLAKLKGSGLAASEEVLKFMNTPLQVTVTTKDGAKVFPVKLNDVLSKSYLAFVGVLVTDLMMKVGWNLAFYNALVKGNDAVKGWMLIVQVMQALAPLTAGLLTSRIPLARSPAMSPAPAMEQSASMSLSPYVLSPVSNNPTSASARSYSSELTGLSKRLEELRGPFLDMLNTNRYNLAKLEELSSVMNEGDLALLRVAYHVKDAEALDYLLGLRDQYYSALSNVALVIEMVMDSPSLRTSSRLAPIVDVNINEMVEALKNATEVLRQAESNGAVADAIGPAILVRGEDIDSSNYPYERKIAVTVNNLGDSSARVKIVVGETNLTKSSESDVVEVPALSSKTLELRVEAKPGSRGIATPTIRVYAEGELLYEIDTIVKLEETFFSDRKGDVFAVSDGPITLRTGNEFYVTLVNSTRVQVFLPGYASDYSVTLNDTLVRSGIIKTGNGTIVGVSFTKPVSGTLRIKQMNVKSQYLSGSGVVSTTFGVSLESGGNLTAQISLYLDNPYPEASLNATNAIFLAIDLIEAESSSALLKIKYEEFNFKDPYQVQILKYNATMEAYIPLRDFKVDIASKTISIEISPGDPVLALVGAKVSGPQEPSTTTGQTTTSSPGTQNQSAGPGTTAMVIVGAAVAIAVIGVALYAASRRKK